MGIKDLEEFRRQMRVDLALKFGEGNIAPFWGNQNSKIVSISQAPSASVIKNQKPFSDKSGEKLRKQWYLVSDEIFYNPDNFYFTAVGMYYPGKGKNGDLKPSLELAKKWLTEELSYLNPELFLVVGTLSAKFFFPKESFTKLVFTNQKVKGKPAFILPHPSPLNIKWFKDHPEFEKQRLKKIRNYIHEVLSLRRRHST